MKLTIVGCGDAFGSGGRGNTCFWLETAKATLVVDFGATALPGLKGQGLCPNAIDAVVLSHLHGDHFGGLPFLLLDYQFLARRERDLLIAGPPGTKERLDAALEVFFPKSTGTKWRFPWRVEEIAVGVETEVLGHTVLSAEVMHQSGAPSTALRLSDGDKTLAYSGDTEWTDALLPIAADADLFICECYAYAGSKITGHMSWEILKPKIPALNARRVMLTHMSPSVLAQRDVLKGEGVLIAADGRIFEF
ncbi:MAG: MBL fold metallo-hydrolase [Pseudolabrys sp.]|jgi:ribonuclease BN (tRNA processing enzyme)